MFVGEHSKNKKDYQRTKIINLVKWNYWWILDNCGFLLTRPIYKCALIFSNSWIFKMYNNGEN